jgi:hypothetical protein
MQSVTPGGIQFQTVPYVGDDRDEQGRSIIRLEDEDTLHDFFAELSAEPTPAGETPAAPQTVAPSAVTVSVFNGSGIAGVAATAAADLTAGGFVVAGSGNADSSDYDQTVIRYAAGDEDLAATVAAAIPGAVTEASEDADSGTVQLVLGTDFNGVGQAVDPAAPVAPVEGEDTRTAANTDCIN